ARPGRPAARRRSRRRSATPATVRPSGPAAGGSRSPPGWSPGAARPLTVLTWARVAGTSARTFVRRFHEATGTTPGQWLLSQRLNRARELLESTTLPIDQVSERSGLGSAANLRHHFGVTLGTTPTAYRRAFQ